MITLGAGLHPDVPEAVYHADPCEQASLSSTVARILIDKSPMHAWGVHPRLNPDFVEHERKRERHIEIGTAAHKLVLGTGRPVDVIEGDDYKTKAAQVHRKEAYEAGNSPILKVDYLEAVQIASACRKQLAATPLAGIFDGGEPELTMVWQDAGTWCRSRLDCLPRGVRDGGHVIVPDYKTTTGSAHPDDFTRTLFEQGYDVQAAFYERGLRALIPSIRSVEFVFVVQEQDSPYALSIVGLGGQALELAKAKADVALKLWRTCLKAGQWPGYPTEIVRAEIPYWRAERTEFNNMALLDRLSKWQSPLHDRKGERA